VIVPRWEWRTFGESFGSDAEERFAAITPEQVQESDEIYFLSEVDDESVKVRAELIDIKRLEQVSSDGLEQWLPVLKTGFPLGAEDAGTVYAALGVPLASPTRTEYTLDEIVDEVAVQGIRPVRVYKRRMRYTINGCMAELTDVRADGEATRTVAVETEDPELLFATVRELGLGSLANVSYPRGLKALLGFGARRYAVIDIGTNSVKFHIGERAADGVWRTVVDRAEVTRLGEELQQTGRLIAPAIERTVEAVAGMVDEAERNGVAEIAAVGTAWMRIAANSDELVAAVRDRCDVEVEVLPGEEEGRLAYLAVKNALGLSPGSLVVFDTGGGSSQFTFGAGERVDEQFSVNVGAARFTEDYGLGGVVSTDVLRDALEAIAADLDALDGRPSPGALVGMGGAITNLTAVKHELATYDPDVVQGSVLELAEVDRQIELYRTRDAEARRTIVGLQPKRAEVILAGACIVRTVMTKLGKESLSVSDRGLRHGLIRERFDKPAS
jgi:exopolyphosphatase/guanosine-5'-triphosphate,3'-diphosphate pyrophosphatase